MPKLKTKRSAAKRVRRTGSGRLKRSRAWKRHKLEAKSPGRKRRLGRPALVSVADQPVFDRLVPYL
jgi:large subunit ribosomal protein L35